MANDPRIDPRMEREYNNRAKVPDHAAVMDGWKRDAAAFRASHRACEPDLAYGASPRQVLDVFWPDGDRLAPTALFIHGGYWQALDKSWFSHLAEGFNGNGLALAVMSYDLCPVVPLAEIVAQTRAACAFLVGRIGRPIYVTGHSAGGHLTAMALATDWSRHGLPADAVAGGLAISGLFDLAPLVATSINGALKLDAAAAAALSPLAMPAPRGTLHAIVGAKEGEEYTRQAREIASAWNGSWEILQDADHFTAIAPLAMPASPTMRRVAAAMAAMARSASPPGGA